MQNQTHPFVFENGDVQAKAICDGREIAFKLSSHALCFASPVWKKFVFPPFPLLRTETPPVDSQIKKPRISSADPFLDIELDFTEDNPEALLVLFRIAHLQFSTIPSSLPYETLHGIAVLCDQYDCRKLVKPWAEAWLRNCWDDARLHPVEWLWIAYFFGLKQIFQDLANDLAYQAIPGGDGDCLMCCSASCHKPPCVVDGSTTTTYPLEKEGCPMPHKISEKLLEFRTRAISQMLRAITNFMEVLADEESPFNCKETCTAAMLGFFIKKLKSHSLWPIPKAEDIVSCAFNLHKRIALVLDQAREARQTIKIPHPGKTCRLEEMLGRVGLGNFYHSRIPPFNMAFGWKDLEIYHSQMDCAFNDIGYIEEDY